MIRAALDSAAPKVTTDYKYIGYRNEMERFLIRIPSSAFFHESVLEKMQTTALCADNTYEGV